MYSGEEEFNVIVHEGGSREQEHTNEEQRVSTTQETSTSRHKDIIDDIVATVLGWGSHAAFRCIFNRYHVCVSYPFSFNYTCHPSGLRGRI